MQRLGEHELSLGLDRLAARVLEPVDDREQGIDPLARRRVLAARDLVARLDERGVCLGVVAASLNVEDFSLNRLARATREEIVARYRSYIDALRVDGEAGVAAAERPAEVLETRAL